MRNSIQHFAAPNIDVSQLTSQFIYEVIDTFINSEWDMCAMDFCDDSGQYEFLIPVLAQRNIYFRVSQRIHGGLKELSSLVADGTIAYQNEMTSRGRKAGLI